MNRNRAVGLTWYGIRTVILSPAKSKAMAWNLRIPFDLQLKNLRKKEKKKKKKKKNELSLKVMFNKA